jgi:squalene-associated FAD-dependent desaturase
VKPVVVIGGGLSGLAAAVALASSSIPVVLCEQRSAAGGRAFSLRDDCTGDIIDNGQHVLIAAYARTMNFLSAIGTRHLLAIQPVPLLRFHHPRRGFCTFRTASLPPPINLIAGIVMTDLFDAGDRLRLLRAGAMLRSFDNSSPGPVAAMTIEQWLDRAGQSDELKRSFWEPLAIAVMNERIGIASAKVFLHSLRTAFLDSTAGGALAFPAVGLSDLYVTPAIRFIEARGGRVLLGARALPLTASGERIAVVRLAGDEEIPCGAAILAVPSHKVSGLLPEGRLAERLAKTAADVPSSPIVSIHLWFPANFMPMESLGLIGKRVQWLFNRRMLLQEEGAGGHVSAVISGAQSFVDWTNDRLVRTACEDLREVFGSAVGHPGHAVVIREKRATFSCTPEVDATRPGPGTPFRNLFLAGDWTATGFPATLEGAIMSGERCADLARHSVGGGD